MTFKIGEQVVCNNIINRPDYVRSKQDPQVTIKEKSQ